MGQNSSQGSKGLPGRAKCPMRKARRARNWAKRPERKLRRILRRNGEAAALAWADTHHALIVLRALRPNALKSA